MASVSAPSQAAPASAAHLQRGIVKMVGILTRESVSVEIRECRNTAN